MIINVFKIEFIILALMHYAIHNIMTCDIVIARDLQSINYSFITRKTIVVYWLARTLPTQYLISYLY